MSYHTDILVLYLHQTSPFCPHSNEIWLYLSLDVMHIDPRGTKHTQYCIYVFASHLQHNIERCLYLILMANLHNGSSLHCLMVVDPLWEWKTWSHLDLCTSHMWTAVLNRSISNQSFMNFWIYKFSMTNLKPWKTLSFAGDTYHLLLLGYTILDTYSMIFLYQTYSTPHTDAFVTKKGSHLLGTLWLNNNQATHMCARLTYIWYTTLYFKKFYNVDWTTYLCNLHTYKNSIQSSIVHGSRWRYCSNSMMWSCGKVIVGYNNRLTQYYGLVPKQIEMARGILVITCYHQMHWMNSDFSLNTSSWLA